MPSVITLMKVSSPTRSLNRTVKPTASADLGAQLLGDPLRHGAGGQAAGLRVADEAAHAEAELEAQLGQLRALARAGLAGDDDDLVVADRGEQRLAVGDDRQVGVGRDAAARATGGDAPRRSPAHGWLDGFCFTWAFTAFVKPRS